jgi:hypothetical protein
VAPPSQRKYLEPDYSDEPDIDYDESPPFEEDRPTSPVLTGRRDTGSVANRPKFLPENAKVAPEKYQRAKKSAVEFSADLM